MSIDTPRAERDVGRRRLRVGFLHVGRERSGVRRYGRIPAEAAAHDPTLALPDSDVGERDAPIGDEAGPLREAIAVALRSASREPDANVRRLAVELTTPRIVARYAETDRAAGPDRLR
jgi:hypothetical protein